MTTSLQQQAEGKHGGPDRVRVIAELRAERNASASVNHGQRRWLFPLLALVAFGLGAWSTFERGWGSGETTDTVAGAVVWTYLGVFLVLSTIAHRRERRALLAANTDLLTGLPNRRQFLDELEGSLRRRSFASSGQVALLLIDLDRFKYVNDSFGHSAGDILLKDAATRLRNSISSADHLARLGGDEFVVIRRGVSRNEDVERLAAEIVAAFEAPFNLGEQPTVVTASVGTALGQPGHIEPEELLIRADAAMYEAKQDQSTGHALYQSGTTMLDRHRLTRESELRAGLENGELVLYFQPQYNLARLELLGFEALIRWRHPSLGLLTPDKFIHLAEESRQINDLTRFVVQQAFQEVNEWRRLSASPAKLSLNLSVLDLRHAEFLHELSQMLQDDREVARDLVFEVTETVLLRDPEGAAKALADIQNAGAKVAIDDFGTGYCSLAYLSRLPAEILKIDKSFAVDSALSPRGRNLLKAIADLGRSLDMLTLLEGIESQRELAQAIMAGFDAGQGYFLGRPVTSDEARRLLLSRTGAAPTNPIRLAS